MKPLAILAALCACAISLAQFTSSNVTQSAWLSNAALAGGDGNDCWGYVSPSGREYALMGQVDQMTVVEVTNPAAPVIIQAFPHLTSTWSDIKVYRDHAYVVTEAAGSGIMVINLSQVDQGIVTLVRTIASPGSSHNIHIDETSGFLYTCGSRTGTGTTMCFDLSNPGNPVRVGANSLTTNYMHDVQVNTFTSGPYAGRQILYGFSESRGVDLYDVTNKSVPVFLARATYTNIGYCHQGWLSADRKYLFVDDELDEQNFGGTTRSLVFNVENINAPVLVGTFSSGLSSIDHNQYWDDGFLFQANYRSGLRIFDAKNPTAPVQVGNYDTYPSSNSAQFSGAWSTYPFFPSGTVIVSDINRGLFVLNASAALTRTEAATTFQLVTGALGGGSLSSLTAVDSNVISVRFPKSVSPLRKSAEALMKFKTFDTEPQNFTIDLQSGAQGGSALETVSLLNVQTKRYEVINTRNLGEGESLASMPVTVLPKRFVNQTTNEVTAKVKWTMSTTGRGLPAVRVNQFRARVLR
ncbi:MAG: choice-of-anchor B family protein [Chthonomonas sp.]|nr:choice-of-anchor B family protein [Chthonomonas sp.]